MESIFAPHPAGRQPGRPAQDLRGDERGERVLDQLGGNQRTQQHREPLADGKAQEVDQDDARGHETGTGPLAQADQDHQQHRQQGQRDLVRHPEGTAPQRHRGMQQRKEMDDPSVGDPDPCHIRQSTQIRREKSTVHPENQAIHPFICTREKDFLHFCAD